MEEGQSTDLDNINIDDWNVEGAKSNFLKPIFKCRMYTTFETSDHVAEKGNQIDPTDPTKPFDVSLRCSNVYDRPPPKSRLFCSCRLILSIISCLGFVNLYILRFNLNVAMTWMVNKEAVAELERAQLGILPNATTFNSRPTCLPPVSRTNLTSIRKKKRKFTPLEDSDGEFVWSKRVRKIILSSFFWGYLLTQIPGGWLAERYGGKLFLGLAILASSFINILIPWAAWIDYRLLIAIRFFLGIVQGVSWPSMYVIWSRWATPSDKQKLTSLTYAGTIIGLAITFPAVAMLCDEDDDTLGWSYVFYSSGIIGVLWTFAWIYFVFDSPENHPRISRAEKEYIYHFLGSTISMSMKNHPPTPWKQILTSIPFWVLVAATILYDITANILLDSISSYMKDVFGSGKKQTAWINAIPHIGFFLITILSAFLYDIATFKHNYCSTTARKVGNTIGTLVPGIIIFAACFMQCEDKWASIVLIIACSSMSGFQYGAGFLNNFTDLAPQHVGVLFGIANMISNVIAATIPFVINVFVTNENRIHQWHALFAVLAAIFFLDTVIFVVFGSAEIQKWAGTPDETDTTPANSKRGSREMS